VCAGNPPCRAVRRRGRWRTAHARERIRTTE
jgi:hypothetical protein